MASGVGTRAKSVLETLADLSPTTEGRGQGSTIPLEWFRWLSLGARSVFGLSEWDHVAERSPMGSPNEIWTTPGMRPSPEMFAAEIDADFGERLAAVDELRLEQRSLRVGWLFVAGRAPDGRGGTQSVFQPLVTIPVAAQRTMFRTRLVPVGDAELTPLITDSETRLRLEEHMEFGSGALLGDSVTVDDVLLQRLWRLREFAIDAGRAAGFDVNGIVSVTGGPDAMAGAREPRVVAGVAVYALHDAGGLSRAATLHAWDERQLDEWTAFHSLYLTDYEPPQDEQNHEPVESAYPLARAERSAVLRSRSEPITVISGAPGTGKSHSVVAIGLDAIARGESVLVSARSDAAVDALMSLFERAPIADPVVFGSAERRERLAVELASGRVEPASSMRLQGVVEDLDAAVQRRDDVHSSIAEQLRAEAMLEDRTHALAVARGEAPYLFDPTTDLDRIADLLRVATTDVTGWRARRQRRHARSDLEHNHGVTVGDDRDVAGLLQLARADRAAMRALDGGGISISADWDALAASGDEVRRRVGEWLAIDARAPDRFDRRSLRAVAALATALRSGRAARRVQLARLNSRDALRALPLWVGTLADVDDLLPPVAGLFDVVILDEASSIEQTLAASALLRARRAVIVGDPHQLRHVSFMSESKIQDAVVAHDLDDDPATAAALDVRRNSIYDVAAGVATVVTLDENFRSAPHLVEFVAERLYPEPIHVASRCPDTESLDCVDVIRLDGRRDDDGVVVGEVKRVITELRELLLRGARSVGVVTPFRAQADALEHAVLDAFSSSEIKQLSLRVGTAHAFQGNERDVIIISLGIGVDDKAGTWTFVEDPHLLAVLLTRARKRVVFVHSADPPPGSIVADYLDHADTPPGRPVPLGAVDDWTHQVVENLAIAGVAVVAGYPSGQHVVDICFGDRFGFLGIECRVHEDGPEAHIERHLALQRFGWQLCDAFPSRWRAYPGELVVELMQRIGR
jgi:hypothetical protein